MMTRHTNIETDVCSPATRPGFRILVLAGLLAMLPGCGDGAPGGTGDEPPKEKHTGQETDGETDSGNDTDSGSDTDASLDTEMPAFDCAPRNPELAEADADDLFGASSIPVFDVYLPPATWADLQIDARDEEYVRAEACYEGQSLGEIGLRFKGSYGSLYGCFDSDDNMICRKLSMKMKFSEYDPEGRFFGMKRLNFQAYKEDDTYMKERLSYDLFRAMDIATPRAAWAELRVNGEPRGLFGMVEQVDGRFTADRFPEAPDNNLYKELWPVLWPEFDPETWILSQLKTNEEEGDISSFLGFVEALSEAEETALRETLGEYMDLDALARYMAADDAINNVDGVTAYYTSADLDFGGNHNYYLYEDAPAHFTLIPWDEDNTLAMRLGFGAVPRWTAEVADCDASYPAWGGIYSVMAPGCDPLFTAIRQDLAVYRESARSLLEGPFAEAAMGAAIDGHEAFLRDAVAADPHGPGLEAFDLALARLRADLPLLRERLERLADGPPIEAFNLSLDAVHDFEAVDEMGLWAGTELLNASNTAAEVSLNRDDPIGGDQSFRLSFDYGNTDAAWGQWMHLTLLFDDGYRDVTDLTGIRMRLRADEPRTLRLDLASPEASALLAGVSFGWDIRLTEEAEEVEVLFEEAEVVSWAVQQGLDPGDDLADLLETLGGIRFFPQCNRRLGSGFLPEDTRDVGFIEVDDLEFF